MQNLEAQLNGSDASFRAHGSFDTAPSQASLTGEDLKAALVSVDPLRSLDALVGVHKSPWQNLAESATYGPFDKEALLNPGVASFLSDPTQVVVIACGRNEHQRGNLVPTLRYIKDSGANAIYVDANSTDGSARISWSMNTETISRRDMSDKLDIGLFAQILGAPKNVMERLITGEDVQGYPPLRKGIEVMTGRIHLLEQVLRGEAPRYALWMDTDLKSIPHGSLSIKLLPDQMYRPLQLAAAGILSQPDEAQQAWAVYTGSENRNNEPVFAAHNMVAARGASRLLDPRQKDIAKALGYLPGLLVHPLTGELITSTASELNAMNATGQCVETARNLSLAGSSFAEYQTMDPEALQHLPPLIANVRRGTQQRIDEPQTLEKEWWMILNVIPPFITVISEYCIASRKLPHELTLDDYAEINRELGQITTGSQLNGGMQIRQFDQFPMERAIPPVSLLYQEGIIKI